MKKILYFEVIADAFEDTNNLKKKLKRLGACEFNEFDINEKEREFIFQHGITAILNPKYFEFLGTPSDDKNSYIAILQKFLDNIINGRHLIIIDSYIFPGSYDNDYTIFLIDTLKRYFTQLDRISFITKGRFNKDIQIEIFNAIKRIKPELNIEVKTHENFHDRFWLCDNKGVFIGTSLNGLGKKYTLIDYINKRDVESLFNEIRTNNIVSL